MAVSGDGGIPVLHRAFDRRAGEVKPGGGGHGVGAGHGRQAKVPGWGDSKLVSYANLRAMIDAGVSFVAPASKIYVSAATLAGQDRGSAAPADYVADRDRNIAAEDRGSYRMMEDAMVLAPKRKADPDLALRRIFM